MGGRVAVGLALLVWAGLALGATHPGWVWPALLAGAVLAPCAGARHDLRGTLALTLVALLVALARGGASRTLIEHQALAIGHADPNGEPTLWFEARVVDHPWREADAPSAVVRTLQDEPGLPRGTRLRLWLPAGCNAEWGDTLQVLARLETPGALR